MLSEKIKKAVYGDRQPAILVIGDLMIDHYIHGKAKRLSPEAPVPVVAFKSEDFTLGGAGNVVQNLVSLGAEVAVCGAVGNDAAAAQLLDILDTEGVNTDTIVKETDRTTTVKTRILVDGHQLARLDKECVHNLSTTTEDSLVDKLSLLIEETDVVVLSDYNKGFLSTDLTRRIIMIAKSFGKKVIIDPKGTNYLKYSGAYIIKPNRSELAVAAKLDKVETGEDLQVAANIIIEQTEAENLVVTLSEEGIIIFSNGVSTILPVKASEVYDVTGAGDTVLATIAYFIALGIGVVDACEIANHAAAIVIRQIGSSTTTINKIISEIENQAHKLQPVN